MNINSEFRPKSWRRRLTVAMTAVAVIVMSGFAGALLYRLTMTHGTKSEAEAGTTYYCPMHPSYKSDKPGNCPICSMKLVPLEAPAASATAGPEKAPGVRAPEKAAPANQMIRISPERQQQIGVKFSVATIRPATVEIRAVGRVAYDETRVAHVHTKVSGWIEDVFIDFIGEPVRKGQPLFTIYSPELVSAQEEYLLALRGQKELGGSSFERVSEGSRALLDAARRRLELWDMTSEQIEALEKRGSVSRTIAVVSSVDGVVTERAAYHHGRTVTPDLDLYTIVDISRVWVLAQVYEYELPHVHVGQPAEAVLPYDPERKPLQGKVRFVPPFLNPMTRTAEIRLEFPNPDLRLKPETFVNVSLRSDLGPSLVVPEDAVMDTGQSQYVFVDQGDGYLEPRPIKAGPVVAGGRVIADGVKAGERVVTAANFILDSESRLKGALDVMGRPVPAETASSGTPGMRAEVTTEPSPARIGKNKVRVSIADADGRPIEDADVEIRLFMPQMIGMAQVDVKARLQPAGHGLYTGDVEIPIAWTFSTTITARKEGRVIGTAETSITAR